MKVQNIAGENVWQGDGMANPLGNWFYDEFFLVFFFIKTSGVCRQRNMSYDS